MSEHDEGVWLHARHEITIVELAETSGVAQSTVRELVEYGALTPAAGTPGAPAFNADCVARVRAAARLCSDLELDPGALPLVLSLLERIHDLEGRVNYLAAQLGAPHR